MKKYERSSQALEGLEACRVKNSLFFNIFAIEIFTTADILDDEELTERLAQQVINMTDPISNLGRSAAQLNLANEKVKHSKTDAIPMQTEKVEPPKNDEVVLSGASESALANAEFNAEKVAKIRAAIEQGNYPIDARKVAESFASLERMIGGE